MPFRLQKENSTVHVADDESNSKSSQKMELKDVYLDAKKKFFLKPMYLGGLQIFREICFIIRKKKQEL